MSRVLKAVKEASISVACLLDDIAVDENNDINIFEIEKDIEHIQDQITIIENFEILIGGGGVKHLKFSLITAYCCRLLLD